MSTDPWSTFLEWLSTVLVPDWAALIGLVPYVLVVTLVGPILTLLVLLWAWHLVTRRRGRVRRTEVQPVAAALLGDGTPVFPPNVPYCEEHRLIYPPRARRCEIDRADLMVACPVDGSVRPAEVDTCSACGTRYKLGAAAGGTLVVVRTDGPPEGGAAIA
jgi:hypothetical protein